MKFWLAILSLCVACSGLGQLMDAGPIFAAAKRQHVVAGACPSTITVTTSKNWSDLAPQPTSADLVVVRNAATLTVDVSGDCCGIQLGIAGGGSGLLSIPPGSVLTCAGNVTLGEGASYGTLQFDTFADSTLKIGGDLVLTSGAWTTYAGAGTIEFNSAGDQTVGSLVYGRLVTSGGGIKSLGANTGANAGARITIIGVNTTLDATANNYQFTVSSAWTNNGTFNARAGGVIFGGASAQNLSGATTFNNFTSAGPALTLYSSITVNSNLAITAGKITTGANTLAMGSGGIITDYSSVRFVVGNLQKAFATGSGQSFAYRLGKAGGFAAPITLANLNVTVAGNILATTTSSDHADVTNSGIDPNLNVTRYWTLTAAGGLVASTCDVICGFSAGDIDPGATTANFVIRKLDGTWATTTTGTRTSTSTEATGLSSFGDFVVGEQLIDHYVVAATSPQTTGVNFGTTVTAKDILNVTTIYDSATTVTMSSSTSNAQYDADELGAFDNYIKALVSGSFTIITKDAVAEMVDLIATDDLARTGTRSSLVVNAP